MCNSAYHVNNILQLTISDFILLCWYSNVYFSLCYFALNFFFCYSHEGLIEADIARRLLNNYNLVNQLDFSAQLIENTIKSCSTTDDKVSVDDLIDELKSHL